MTLYAVLLPGDESTWAEAPPEQRAATYERHGEFAKALAKRGHTITGGAELTPSRTARTLRGRGDHATVTDGPYAESAEQLTGFYLVESEDLDDLVEVAKILADDNGGVEIRACVDMAGDPS